MGLPLAPDPAWAQSLGETRLRLVKARRTSLSIIHLFMFISGVEYAVVFPSLWEYLQSLGVPSSSSQWLGITLSAMTLTDIFSSLIVGRILDTRPGIKFMVIALNLPQIVGACLYLFANSPILLLASRLVSGLGKAISVVFLTDVCRSTEKNDRTPVLLLFNIAFQVGLLIGPAANLALSLIDLATPLGRLTKLNSPGLLLWLLWFVFSFLVCALYTDLTVVSRDEKVAEELARAYVSQESRPVSGRGSEAGDADHVSDHTHRDVSEMVQNHLVDLSNASKAPDLFDDEFQPLINSEERHSSLLSSEESLEKPEEEEGSTLASDEIERPGLPPLVFTVTEETYPTQLSARRSISPIALDSPTSSLLVSQVTQIGSASPATLYGSITLSSMRRARRGSTTSRKSDIVINAAELMMGVERESEEEEDEEEERSDGTRSRGEEEQVLLLSRPSRREEPEQEVPAPSLSEVLEVLLREELVALAFLRFVALFCQTGLEAVVPPVMQLYFDFGDLANSLLYLGCGLQLILVFLILSAASKAGASDRTLIGCGLVIMIGALVWLMSTLPSFAHHTPANLPYFVVGVFIDLAGIPTVCDVALALYSKLLPDRVQGAGQAFRRLVSQLALLLGPLWAPATLNNPMLMLAVPLGLLLLGAILFMASWRWMRVEVEVEEMETAL